MCHVCQARDKMNKHISKLIEVRQKCILEKDEAAADNARAHFEHYLQAQKRLG